MSAAWPLYVEIAKQTVLAVHEYARGQQDMGYSLDEVVDELLCLALEIQESRAQDRDTERRLMEMAG